jgi:hypothetical protein
MCPSLSLSLSLSLNSYDTHKKTGFGFFEKWLVCDVIVRLSIDNENVEFFFFFFLSLSKFLLMRTTVALFMRASSFSNKNSFHPFDDGSNTTTTKQHKPGSCCLKTVFCLRFKFFQLDDFSKKKNESFQIKHDARRVGHAVHKNIGGMDCIGRTGKNLPISIFLNHNFNTHNKNTVPDASRRRYSRTVTHERTETVLWNV